MFFDHDILQTHPQAPGQPLRDELLNISCAELQNLHSSVWRDRQMDTHSQLCVLRGIYEHVCWGTAC